MDYYLCNVQYKARVEPDFKIAPRSEREGLRPGDFAQLLFQEKKDGKSERMWVRMAFKSKAKKRWYLGSLANTPIFIRANMGDKVWFHERHILAVGLKETVITAKNMQEAANKIVYVNTSKSVHKCPHCLGLGVIEQYGRKFSCPYCNAN